ncbi:MAG: hypothetical protein AVDCRST_MAG03-978 [uncultured Rubrobacteraceae bacterium]|uniref:Uncharacterized protein n=1 Tax=uncultured Rubrobacteraceae bacterium TaxID=349277 RepID=A0A6J4P0C5_9ACTN|nr:MAG: hypothetical protein AVDCRST_MAG03-978 [uncultured Rubrobacteraceae bacterium]
MQAARMLWSGLDPRGCPNPLFASVRTGLYKKLHPSFGESSFHALG